MQSGTFSIALLVLSKSSASGNIVFPTSQSDGKGFLIGLLTIWYNLLASAFVGVKLLCLYKGFNVCGPKDLDYFQDKIILGMRETQRQGKIRREEKLASAHSCCCFTLNWFYVLLTVQG